MAKTASQIIAVIKRNIGGREQGTLGADSIDAVCLDAVNDAILGIAKRWEEIPSLHKMCKFIMTLGQYRYDIPTTDEDSIAFPGWVKSILGLVIYKTGDTTFFPVEQLHTSAMDPLAFVRVSSVTRIPRFFSLFGEKIEFDVYPDQAYEVRMRVSILPAAITINQTQPLGTLFDDVIEASATSNVFNALQQSEDGAVWEQIFEKRFRNSMQALRSQPMYSPRRGLGIGPSIGNPAFDPFVRRYT